MAFDVFKYTNFPTNQAFSSALLGAYMNRAYGTDLANKGYGGLYQLLLGQGNVDPRLLAAAQAQNARATQGQQDALAGSAARSGMTGSGLYSALNAATGAAGATRAANLDYQNIADAYQRNQENLGLFNQLYIQPSLGYGSLGLQYGLGQQQQKNQQKAGWLGFASSLLGGAGKAFGM